MSRHFLPLVLLTVMPLASIGQQNDQNLDVKEKAKVLLDRVKAKYNDYSTIQVDFSFTLENKKQNNFKEVREGTATLKDQKFRINLGSHLIICDNDNVWTYLKEANEVQVNNYKPDQMKINPSQMFTIYQEGFLYGYKGEKSVKGKDYYQVELTPEDKEKSFYKIRLLISQDSYRVGRTKVFEKDGSIYTYDFESYTVNKDLPNNHFEFDKEEHPSANMIDLRK